MSLNLCEYICSTNRFLFIEILILKQREKASKNYSEVAYYGLDFLTIFFKKTILLKPEVNDYIVSICIFVNLAAVITCVNCCWSFSFA